MSITCPNCSTSYAIPLEKLGAKGRVVKCARCNSSWRAMPGISPALQAFSAGDTVTKDQLAETQRQAERQVIDNAPSMETPASSIASTNADITIRQDDAEDVVSDEHIAAAAQANNQLERARTRATARRMFGFMAIVSAVSILAGSYYFRDDIVAKVPSVAGLYQAAGVEVNIRGLQFRDIKTFNETNEGVKSLIVKGTVVNITNKAVNIPAIRLAMRSDGIQEVYSWSVMPEKTSLAPGESYDFSTRVETLPANASDLQLKFVKRDDVPIIKHASL